MKFAVIQARFINIVVVNISKSSAQTILLQLNIEFTNFFWKIFIRSVHYTGKTFLDIFRVIQFTNGFHTLPHTFHGINTFRKIIYIYIYICPLLGVSLTKIVTFGTKNNFVRYSRHARYLGCPLLGAFTVHCARRIEGLRAHARSPV